MCAARVRAARRPPATARRTGSCPRRCRSRAARRRRACCRRCRCAHLGSILGRRGTLALYARCCAGRTLLVAVRAGLHRLLLPSHGAQDCKSLKPLKPSSWHPGPAAVHTCTVITCWWEPSHAQRQRASPAGEPRRAAPSAGRRPGPRRARRRQPRRPRLRGPSPRTTRPPAAWRCTPVYPWSPRVGSPPPPARPPRLLTQLAWTREAWLPASCRWTCHV